MKIGIFTESYKPYTSGVVTSISTFKDELTRLGHDIYIFAPSYPNQDEEEDNVFRYFSIPAPTNPGYTLALPVHPGMPSLMKKLQLDIIHVHSPFTLGRVGLHYARKFDLPMLFTYHTRYDQYVHYVRMAQDLVKDVTIKYSRHFCNERDHIIAPSHEIESIIRSFLVTTPITVVPTGIPLEKFQDGNASWLRKNYPIPPHHKILLYAGRLSPEKNIPFLIESFQRIRCTLPDTTLVLVAGGPLEEELREFTASMGWSEQDVVFTGQLPFESLVNAYFAADLFVFSSLTETQGLVLVEAMAAGLPVVAVRASGVREMVRDGTDGLLTNENSDEFAAAVCRILQDDRYYRHLQANARHRAEQMSSQNMALILQDVYEQLNGSEHHRSRNIRKISSWIRS
ncbi:MAG: glycosyltransferase family 4 protein [Syntrophomonadaceae bacterium]|nr:glycosyltransferase family 4 protein [Syntrophomonadaceae bacterium]